MTLAGDADKPRESGIAPDNHSLLSAMKREANVPRELYRTWIWRGPAAVVNRTGKASLIVTAGVAPGKPLTARLFLRLEIKKGSNRSAWIYFDHVTAQLYKQRIPRVVYPEPSITLRPDPPHDPVLLNHESQVAVDLPFGASIAADEASKLPSGGFRALVSGVEMELDHAGARKLWPLFVWGERE